MVYHLFLLYTADLIQLIKGYDLSTHLYADDTQVYGSCRPSSTAQLLDTHVRMSSWCRHLDALQPAAAKHCQVGSHLVLIDPASAPNSTESAGGWLRRSRSSACSPWSGYFPRFWLDDADAHRKECFELFCGVTTTSQHPAVGVSPSPVVTCRCTGADKAWLWKHHAGRTSSRSTRQAAVGTECCSAANLQMSEVH